jgi:uncharacterized protein YjbI with pentapeptide repeats
MFVGGGPTLTQLYSTASYRAHDLSGVALRGNNMANANLAGQNLTNADFSSATLTNTDFTGAEVRCANFGYEPYYGGTGITLSQLYSTASYLADDLSGIKLWYNDLAGGNFARQNLANARFEFATLTGANFREANLTNASFFFAALTDANFREANLTNAQFQNATLTDTDFTNATVRGASFRHTTPSGFTAAQLYSTASYQAQDLSGINLGENDLTGWNFSGQNLTNSTFGARYLSAESYSTLTGADFTGADTRGARYLDMTGATTTNLIHADGHIAGLNLASGEKLVAYSGVPIPVHVSGGFTIVPTATMDVTDNAMIVNYSGDSPAANVRDRIITGRGGIGPLGRWTGTGITSSTAAAANQLVPDSRSIGYAENATLPLGPYGTFRGAAVDDMSILIAFTRTGDANLDGLVNNDDVTIVGANYAPGFARPRWDLGDFDYNGFVDNDDVTLLGVYYNPAATAIPAPTASSEIAAVPEPATLALVAVGLLGVLAIARDARRSFFPCQFFG